MKQIDSWPISQLNALQLSGQCARGYQGLRLNPWVASFMNFPGSLGSLCFPTILPSSTDQWLLPSPTPTPSRLKELQQNGSKNQTRDMIVCTWINQWHCFVLKGAQMSLCPNRTLSLLNEASERWFQRFPQHLALRTLLVKFSSQKNASVTGSTDWVHSEWSPSLTVYHDAGGFLFADDAGLSW